MDNKKEYCDKLYNRYKELKEKTDLEAQEVKPNGEIKAKYISKEDILEREKIKQEIKECLDCLSDDQLIELCEDEDFCIKATQILAERKKRNR